MTAVTQHTDKSRIEEKIAFEQRVIAKMITLYCKKNHEGTAPCSECASLVDYAQQRTERCPYTETKTFCLNCQTHCYQPAMRERIREVMRFSGPRMLLHHPILLARHVHENHKDKRRIKNPE